MKIKAFLSFGLGALMSIGAFAQNATHTQGIEYYDAGQPDYAKELLERNFNNAGTDKALSNYYLGRIALDEGNKAEARKYFEAGIAANPECGYNYEGLGAIQLLDKDAKGAESNFKLAEKYVSKENKAQLQAIIAEAYYDTDPVTYAKQVEKYIEKARKSNMHEPMIYLLEGNMARDNGNISEAAGNYDMAINFNPQAVGPYVKYANLYRKVNPGERINQLKNLIKANPDSAIGQKELAEAYYDYAEQLKSEGKEESAAKYFKLCSDQYATYLKNPNHFKRDEEHYAFLLFLDGDYQKGYDFATNLLKENPNNFTAKRFQFINAANIPSMQDQCFAMAQDLYATHKANPKENAMAPIDYNLIAEEYSLNDRSEESIAVLNEALNNPALGNVDYFNKTIAQYYVKLNQFTKAAESFNKYLDKAGDKASYGENLQGALYNYFAGRSVIKEDADLSKKLFDKAVALANKASQLFPEEVRPYKLLGDVAIAQSTTQAQANAAAVDMYTKALELYEANPKADRQNDAIEMYNYMGNYNLDKKDKATAKAYFSKVLQLKPDDANYRKFVESL